MTTNFVRNALIQRGLLREDAARIGDWNKSSHADKVASQAAAIASRRSELRVKPVISVKGKK